MVNGFVVKHVRWNHLLDDLLFDLLPQLFRSDVLAVLSANDDGVYPLRNHGAIVMFVFDRDLCFGVGPQPGQAPVVPRLLHRPIELVCEEDGQGEILGRFVGGITEHDTLVAGAKLLEGIVEMQAASDIWGLLLDCDEDIAGLVVETLVGAIVADVTNGVPDDFLVVEVCFGRDLTKDHDHACQKRISCACTKGGVLIGSYRSW